jgi:hypothetical protein
LGLVFFVEFEGEAVGVGEEEEPSAGVFVGADGLVGDAEAVEVTDGVVDVVDLKGQVTQSCGFGMRRPRGRGGEGEKLDDVGVTQCKVGFVRLPIGAIMFGAEGEPEDVGIEL